MKLCKIFLPLLLTLTSAVGFAADKTVTKPVSVAAGFTDIDVATGIKLIYTPASTTRITITGTPEDISKVEFVRSGSTLKIYRSNSKKWNFNSRRGQVIVTMSAPALKGYELSSGASIEVTGRLNVGSQKVDIDASSGSAFTANGLICSSLDVDASSGATVRVGGISASDIEVEASSGSLAELSGRCSSVDLSASSGASVRASSLKAGTGSASASSGASVSSSIAKSKRIHKSSGGSVTNNSK